MFMTILGIVISFDIYDKTQYPTSISNKYRCQPINY